MMKAISSIALLATAALAAGAPLSFRIDEGLNINSFLRDGPVAAHLLLRSGTEPRILVAFPAGNSGVGLWFKETTTPVTWTLVMPPRPVMLLDQKRRPLRGIEFEVEADASELRPRAAVLSSVRVLRDYELLGKSPAEVMVAPRRAAERLSWARDRLDTAAGYRLTIEAVAGAQVSAERFTAANGAPLRLRIQALTGEPPLQPLDSILATSTGNDARARNALAFLSYQEKFLAGSWRFNTYFGRDTMISALLLAPVLEPQAIESALASVLDRLAPNGEVAHEEDIGEFAVLRNAREGRGRVATPVFDYGMVDDDFLLAPLAVRWLVENRTRARAFLAGKGVDGTRRGSALARNLCWVVERAAAFADDPRATNLVEIKPGRMTGNWRDSELGLGTGRYAYDVNAALVPAALAAAARLAECGQLDEYLDASQRRTLAQAGPRARVWAARAPRFPRREHAPISVPTRGKLAWMASEPCTVWINSHLHSTRCRWMSRGSRFPSCIRTRVFGYCSPSHPRMKSRAASTPSCDRFRADCSRILVWWSPIPRSPARSCARNSAAMRITARWSGRGSRRCWPPALTASCGVRICPNEHARSCARHAKNCGR